MGCVGQNFTVELINDQIRDNEVVGFAGGRVIAWKPALTGEAAPAICGGGSKSKLMASLHQSELQIPWTTQVPYWAS